ncbi:kinase-like domain-containing protein [Trametes punicea]|nr:kinase-like domain-containing protein [Trametes punicea]
MSGRRSLFGGTVLDGLFNYDIHEELGRGTTAVVYCATCSRGRLRNRFVAVKKINQRPDEIPSSRSAALVASLHSTLCHPSIISLIYSFTAAAGDYHVLELCREGSLADLLCARDPKILGEGEIRSVARALIDALAYLKKELVLHRDVNPSNILIADDRRVVGVSFDLRELKLSTCNAFCGSANYVSQEILDGRPYSFETDLWSLGCVLLTCLSGRRPCDASTPDEVYENICTVRFALPETVSLEGRELVKYILKKNPRDRIPLHRILRLAFFAPPLAVLPLALDPQGRLDSEVPSHPPWLFEKEVDTSGGRYPALLSKEPTRPRPNISACCKTEQQRCTFKPTPLDDITNVYSADSRAVHGKDNRQSPHHEGKMPTARIASAPTTFRRTVLRRTSVVGSRLPTPSLVADRGAPDLPAGDNCGLDCPRIDAPCASGSDSQRSSPRSQLRRVVSDSYGLLGSKSSASDVTGRPVLYSRQTEIQQRISSKATSSTAVTQTHSHTREEPMKLEATLPSQPIAFRVEHSEVTALNTQRLRPQTHKVSRGQLVVLPSRSLLVDFREGERRKGGKGKEVLVISSNGGTIQIFDAPHLSTPCCLAEAAATYTLGELPLRYVVHYREAARCVDKLKSRIPKLVHYSDDAKCMLMANGPPGDIEVVMPPDEDRKNSQEAIRLRLEFRGLTLDISRYRLKPSRGRGELGEWVKKVFALGPRLELAREDKVKLDRQERQALRHLSDFLSICHAANLLQLTDGDDRLLMTKTDPV